MPRTNSGANPGGREADDVMESAQKQIKVGKAKDAVVRVQVLLKPEQQAAFHDRQILDLLDTASSVTIAREVEMEARARLGDLSPESLTPSQLLNRYFESRGEAEDRIQQLVEKAEDLFRDPR